MAPSHLPIRIGIVGHRYIQSAEVEAFIRDSCRRILFELRRRYGAVTALSAIAQGADSIFAEAALSLAVPLEIVCPFERYREDFAGEEAQRIYTTLRAAAIREEPLAFIHRSEDAYYTAMQWVIERSDLLIAAWDGKEGNGRGGTSDAVSRAKGMGLDWIHLDVVSRSSNYHCAGYPYLSNTTPGYGSAIQTL